MDKKLLDILVCPVTKGPLIFDKKNNELISKSAKLLVDEFIPNLSWGKIQEYGGKLKSEANKRKCSLFVRQSFS